MNAIKSKVKATTNHHKGVRTPVSLPWLAVRAFGCGMGISILLLSLFALAFTHTSLPLSLVRPLSCVAAAAGAAVSGLVLAGSMGKLRLVCGLGCGVFYVLCLAGGTLLNCGQIAINGANIMLPVALVLGGVLGGTLAALR